MTKQPIEFDLTDEEPTDRIYTCRVCGATGRWSSDWSWYGSWRDADNDPSSVVTCCSTPCRRQHAAGMGVDSGLVDR